MATTPTPGTHPTPTTSGPAAPGLAGSPCPSNAPGPACLPDSPDVPVMPGARPTLANHAAASPALLDGAAWIVDETCLHDEGAGPEVRETLAGVLERLLSLDMDDPEYERFVREDVVETHLLERRDIEALAETVEMACVKRLDPQVLLPAFFVCFEWYHRLEFDVPRRVALWKPLVQYAEPLLARCSLFAYAKSRYHYYAGDMARATESARRAHELAPSHVGFLNNFSELVLEVSESRLVSAQDDDDALVDHTALQDILSSFEAIPEDRYHPIYYVTRGRAKACLYDFAGAREEFARALAAENKRYASAAKEQAEQQDDQGDQTGRRRGSGVDAAIKNSVYVTEIGEIFNAQSVCNVISNMRSTATAVAGVRDAQLERAKGLDAKMDELDRRFQNERIDLLEFIGFFAGIISFVIASIQLGDGLDFPTRALMVVVTLGCLLVAFGSFSALLEAGRRNSSAEERRAMVRPGLLFVIGAGAAAIVLGMLLYLVIR